MNTPIPTECSTYPINVSQKQRIRKPAGFSKENCSKCGKPLEDTRVGKQRYCKTCHAEFMRKNRRRHGELSPLQKKKANARSYVNVYLKRGAIEKKPCEVCGDIKSQMHHDDYDKPLAVRWFCRIHHLEHHKSMSDAKR